MATFTMPRFIFHFKIQIPPLFTDGCPNDCSSHGDCRGNGEEGWKCHCHTGWKGRSCDQSVEQLCQDGKDDDRGNILQLKID